MINIVSQGIPKEIIKEAKKCRLKSLEKELQLKVIGAEHGEMIQCPSCAYVGKNNRFTCKVRKDRIGLTIKCFSCGLWRRLKN